MSLRLSTRKVFTAIKSNGVSGMRTDDVVQRTGLSREIVRSSLRSLVTAKLIKKRVDWSDMRKSIHSYSPPILLFRIVEE